MKTSVTYELIVQTAAGLESLKAHYLKCHGWEVVMLGSHVRWRRVFSADEQRRLWDDGQPADNGRVQVEADDAVLMTARALEGHG